MASTPVPSTPKLFKVDSAPTPSPGTWRHPRLKEIVRRQNASRFGDANVRRMVWNGGFLILSGFIGATVKQSLLTTGALLDINTHPDVLLFLIRVFFLVNMLVALYPLYRPRDDFTDIPLTPSQRALLGLDPKTASPATPGSTYVTPPRYRLSSGSRNVSPLGLNKTPPSARGSPFNATTKAQDTSPLSPSASPLLHKAIKTGNRDSGRRFSFDSTSSLGRSGLRDTSLFSGPPTPSPTGGRRSSQIFTNKWLYEKSRMHSPDSSVYGR